MPLWSNLWTGSNPGIIDWYTLIVGVGAVLVLTMHGALWVNLKTSGELQYRARSIASKAFWFVCAAVLAITLASFSVQPHLQQSFSARPWLWIFPLIATSGLFAVFFCLSAFLDLWAFLGSAVFVVGLLCSAASGLYPLVLPAVPDAGLSLTIFNVSAPHYGLPIGFAWWIPGFLLALAYSTFVFRHFRGKVPRPRAEAVSTDTAAEAQEASAIV